MSRPNDTNPAYASLAYQLTITKKTIDFFVSQYLGNEGEEPPAALECEHIFSVEDRFVPADEIHSFLDGLKRRRAHLELEMSKFDFVERNNGDPSGIDSHLQLPQREQKAAKGKRLPRTKGNNQGRRKRKANPGAS